MLSKHDDDDDDDNDDNNNNNDQGNNTSLQIDIRVIYLLNELHSRRLIWVVTGKGDDDGHDMFTIWTCVKTLHGNSSSCSSIRC